MEKENDLLKTTINTSLGVQILSTVIDIYALTFRYVGDVKLIKGLLSIEVLVQFIEMAFYVWAATYYTKIENLTPNRYYDWVITTPSMLFILIVYLEFLKNQNQVLEMNDENTTLEYLQNAFKNNKNSFLFILIMNWAMLIFGYLSETNKLDKYTAVFSGFIPFILYFTYIYFVYAKFTTSGTILWAFFVLIWSGYGLSALLPYRKKNICYNILDIVSKNFFGFFLAIVAYFNTK